MLAHGILSQMQYAAETAAEPITATGGSISYDGDYVVHTFTTSGTFEITAGEGEVEYLVIAGGGGGGSNGGGGGAGGYRSSVSGESSGGGASAETPLTMGVGTYTVTIGNGGAGGTSGGNGSDGNDSVFHSITSVGGGGAGSDLVSRDGHSGGSGGGAGVGGGASGTGGAGTTDQGYAGGDKSTSGPNYGGGGGGGAAAVGANGGNTFGGNGGAGVYSSITGTSIARAGGGGSGAEGGTNGLGGVGGGGNGTSNSSVGGAGTANYGGGGGGSGYSSGYVAGGAGGSGIVIVRYYHPFDPTDVAGISAWWDFSDAASVSLSGTDITSVTDLSGNSKTLSVAGTPQYVTAAQNSLNVGRTNGSNNGFLASSFTFDRTSATVYFVAKTSGGGAYDSYFGSGGAGFGNFLLHVSSTGGSGVSITQPSANLVNNTTPNTSWSLFKATFDTGYAVTFLREVDSISSTTTLANTSGTVNTLYFGYSVNGLEVVGDYLALDIGEILIYDNVLSAGDDAAVQNYLTSKWAV